MDLNLIILVAVNFICVRSHNNSLLLGGYLLEDENITLVSLRNSRQVSDHYDISDSLYTSQEATDIDFANADDEKTNVNNGNTTSISSFVSDSKVLPDSTNSSSEVIDHIVDVTEAPIGSHKVVESSSIKTSSYKYTQFLTTSERPKLYQNKSKVEMMNSTKNEDNNFERSKEKISEFVHELVKNLIQTNKFDLNSNLKIRNKSAKFTKKLRLRNNKVISVATTEEPNPSTAKLSEGKFRIALHSFLNKIGKSNVKAEMAEVLGKLMNPETISTSVKPINIIASKMNKTLSRSRHELTDTIKVSTNAPILPQFTHTTRNDIAKIYPKQEKSDKLIGNKNISNGTAKKGSLAFVFDTTGSMQKDLEALRRGAELILNEMIKRTEQPIKNYVLVPFGDPDIGPVTVTNDESRFKEELHRLELYGGGDCPELALSGITAALEMSLPHSYIYVFTDASAADYVMLDSVLDLLQRKQNQITFVLTGDCKDKDSPSYQVYEKIAAASSGLVLKLNKDDVYTVLEYVNDHLDEKRVNLGTIARTNGYDHADNLAVDESLKKITVSVSGMKPQIAIRDPHGNSVTGPPHIVPILDLEQIKVVNIMHPEPGNWTILTGGEGAQSVKVTGLSDLSFLYGFTVHKPNSLEETSHRPLQGAENYLLIEITHGSDSVMEILSAKVLTLDGELLFETPLTKVLFDDGGVNNLYIAHPFVPPDATFYLAISGHDRNGSQFRRFATTAIQSQFPDAPYVKIDQLVEARINQMAVLKCVVESLIQVDVYWFKGDKLLQDIVTRLQSARVDYIIPDVQLSDEGTYRCVAGNSLGNSSAYVNLTVSGDAPKITITPEKTLPMGAMLNVDCFVESALPVTEFALIYKTPSERKEIELLPTKVSKNMYKYTYTVEHSSMEDSGNYTCCVANKGGRVERGTKVNLLPPLTVKINKVDVNVNLLGKLNLTCVAVGASSTEWFHQVKEDLVKASDNLTQVTVGTDFVASNLVIGSVDFSDDGIWLCTGRRNDETATSRARVNVLAPPTIYENANTEEIIEIGKDLNLYCRVQGNPAPKIFWVDPYGNDMHHEVALVNKDLHQYVTRIFLKNISVDSKGLYRCIAENDLGKTTQNIMIHPWMKQTLIEAPKGITISLYDSGQLVCKVSSFPPSSTKWYHNGTEVTGRKVSVDGTVLTFDIIQMSDAGSYDCVASNPLENNTYHAFIKLEGFDYKAIGALKSQPLLWHTTTKKNGCACQKKPIYILSYLLFVYSIYTIL